LIQGSVFGLRTGAVLSDVTVAGATAAGVLVSGGNQPEILRSTIRDNLENGLLCHAASPRVVDSTITGNNASNGGGICCWARSSPSLENCKIIGNAAEEDGGGVFCSDSDPVFTNCVIAGNHAACEGGGVLCRSSSSVSLRNCTLVGNHASCEGGSLWAAGSGHDSFYTLNCVIWGNVPLDVCGDECHHCLQHEDPLFVSDGFFDFERWKSDTDGAARRLPDFVVQEPDYHLRQGSPAVDTGTTEQAPPTDLDGHIRPCGFGVDIGAYELGDCGSAPRFLRGRIDPGEGIDLTDPVYLLNYLFAGGPPPPCLKAADVNDTGQLDLTDAVYLLHHLFLGGPVPAKPFTDCGMDPTIDSLPCASFSPCE
jgi:hypothetical protein